VNAVLLLNNLKKRGVTLAADGSRLVVDGPADALTDDFICQLQEHKAELLSLLQPPEDGRWQAADWQAYFDERAGIREHDGSLPRAEAERLALEDATAQWLRLNPAPASDPRYGCVHCGLGEQPGNTFLPVLAPGGHTWVHDACWERWRAVRVQQAWIELEKAGLSIVLPARG